MKTSPNEITLVIWCGTLNEFYGYIDFNYLRKAVTRETEIFFERKCNTKSYYDDDQNCFHKYVTNFYEFPYYFF